MEGTGEGGDDGEDDRGDAVGGLVVKLVDFLLLLKARICCFVAEKLLLLRRLDVMLGAVT